MSRLSTFVLSVIISVCFVLPSGSLHAGEVVNESARELPIAAEVDVVVAGGSTGAVSAAVAAAEQGASVFLAAPYPYLGEDMTGTLQLWLAPDEEPRSPLAREIYDDPLQEAVDPNRLSFSYEADMPSADIHPDTSPPSLLTDGKWSDAASQSVQYERDTTIVAELKSVQPVKRVQLMFYRRGEASTAGTGFDVASVDVHVSTDKQSWTRVGSAENEDDSSESMGTLAVPVGRKARYVRLDVSIAEPHERMLLGELVIAGPDSAVAKEASETPTPPRPMHVKKVLDDALLDAEVSYLYSCLATEIVRDRSGTPCGIVMANRAGRQAVVAKQIIDATTHASVARAAGLRFREAASKERTVRRVVIGGEPKSGEGLQRRQPCDPYSMLSPNSAAVDGGVYPVFEYAMSMEIDDSYASLMQADQAARSRTYDPKQQYTSDILFDVPPSSIVSGDESANPAIDDVDLEAFQPRDADRLFVLSGYADVPRAVAAEFMRPVNLIEYGTKVGKLAASKAAEQPTPRRPQVTGDAADEPVAAGDVHEFLKGARPVGRPETIPQSGRAVPVLGTYDVVVIGGGTGGAPAGIAAARQGAKTLVVEYLHGLGGVATEGAIAGYYWGNRVGFTSTVLDGTSRWKVEPKKEWFRRELLEAGADIWFGSIGCGAFVDGDRVRGAVVTTPYRRGVVLANTVIDATGNSDVAAAAGAKCDYTDESEFGMQGTGLPGRRLGGSYNNTDFTIVDETDMLDTWHVFVYSKEKYPRAFDHGRLIDTRERRRIVGEHKISILDQLNERTYPDTVVRSWSNFDTHGYTIHPYFMLEHPEKKGIAVHVPLRAMLPKGLKGLMVTGLSISAHRDAVPLIRMQADIQNGGYAAGVAGALAAEADTTIRHIDIEALQKHLVEIGNIPESVLEHKDSFPLSDKAFAAAVKNLPNGRGAAVILTDPRRALPLVRNAYQDAAGDDRVIYAQALATLGADDGVETLIKAVDDHDEWDEGWNYRGMGQFGSALSPLDNLVVQLGMTQNPQVLPTILKKTALLDAKHEFSHHRAVGLALEKLGHPAAAKPLANLLEQPGMTGYVHSNIEVAKERGGGSNTNAVKSRRESLRELLLARALYRCGDYREMGEQILKAYTEDLRGHLARHAEAVLNDEKQ